MFIAVVLVATALISGRLYYTDGSSKAEDQEAANTNQRVSQIPLLTQKPPPVTNHIEQGDSGYQFSTNLEALSLSKRLFVTNNFVPAVNRFLQQFPTQHHPIDAKNLKAVSVNYGINGYVWTAARIESGDGPFQVLTQTIEGTNHIQSFRDLTDFDIYAPGTVSDLKKFPSGSSPSSVTTASQAKAFVSGLLQQNNFPFQDYLSPPVAVPYTGCPNYGLWEVRYLRKSAGSNHEFIGFVVDGTGESGPYLRLVEQSSAWSLPSTLQKKQ